MSAYHRPETLSQAFAVLAQDGPRLLAGGTDLYAATDRQTLAGPILDLGRIGALRGIAASPEGLRVGACTTWAEIARYPGPPGWTALAQAARLVGGRQVQTTGTIGGNLCNASPAADGVPPLMALDAEVEIASASSARRLPLAQFLLGPRSTALLPGEILAAIHLPAFALADPTRFLKLGARSHLVISIVMVAARLRLEAGHIVEAALAVGACGPTARRLPKIEAALIGASRDHAAVRIDSAGVAAALAPIDDVRATAAYRAEAATELLRRVVTEILR